MKDLAMDAAALRIFRAVADTGSVIAAAERVNSVPSNVSTRIRKLESTAGSQLFFRESRGMRLTPAGEILKDYADRILALTDEARIALQDAAGDGGSLRLASMESTAAARLPPLLAAFHQAHPRVRLSLTTGTTAAVIDAVLERRADWGFVGGPVDHERLEGRVVFVEEMVLAVPHAVTGVADAETRTMLAFRPGCSYRAHTETWLRQKGRPPKTVMEFGTLDGILGCVAAGMGITLLPRVVVEAPSWAGRVRALTLEDTPNRIETWLIRHKDAIPTKAMSRFQEFADRSA
jgi:DNA-binding transcriptional LysR family regulator